MPRVGARRLLMDPRAADAVHAALSALQPGGGALVPADLGAPVILSATDYGDRAAAEFVARRDNGSRRLRPSDSLALEPSGLLQSFAAATGWRGPAYVLGTHPQDGEAAVVLARAMAGSGRASSVYVCEVLRCPETGGFWALATRVSRPDPSMPAFPPVTVPGGFGAALWERSAVVRAYRRQLAPPT